VRVAELAAAVGVSGDTIRFYEREGLSPAPERPPAGYRRYDPSVEERVRFIRGCQPAGSVRRTAGAAGGPVPAGAAARPIVVRSAGPGVGSGRSGCGGAVPAAR